VSSAIPSIPGLADGTTLSSAKKLGLLDAFHVARLSSGLALGIPSGCAAWRDERLIGRAHDRLPPGMRNSRDLQSSPMRAAVLSCEQALVCGLAKHGVSLRRSTLYVWPFISGPAGAAAIAAAGVLEVVTPDLHVPARLQEDAHRAESVLAQCSVLVTKSEPPTEIFEICTRSSS
jgi:hypothetical protein